MTLTNDKFAELVLARAGRDAFTPTVRYDRDGDCIEFVATPVAFYAKRLDNLVTVYLSEENDEVVGSLIKGVSNILRTDPELRIEIHDGRIRLEHIFRRLGTRADGEITYRRLADVAEAADAEAELCLV